MIDPIDEFGVFVDGFGWQTGRVAGSTDDPDAPDLGQGRGRRPRAQGLLVATERYTHSYPHCWRCGTQLIFRLVDEWFIAMDRCASGGRGGARRGTGCRRTSASRSASSTGSETWATG